MLVVPVIVVRLVLPPGLLVPGVDFTGNGITRSVRVARLGCWEVVPTATATGRLPVLMTAVPAVLNLLRRNLPADVRIIPLPAVLPCDLVGRRRVVPMLLRPEARSLVATIPTVDAIALLRPLAATVSPSLVSVVVRRVPPRQRRILAAHCGPTVASPAALVVAAPRVVGEGRVAEPGHGVLGVDVAESVGGGMVKREQAPIPE